MALRTRIGRWNVALVEFVKAFCDRHSDVTAEVYDAAKLFNDVLDNPTQYGFNDGTSSGDPEKSVWQDTFHPTTAMHKFIAADVYRFLTAKEQESIWEETAWLTSFWEAVSRQTQ